MSRARVAGSHETYTIRSGAAFTTASSSGCSQPARGGSRMMTSACVTRRDSSFSSDFGSTIFGSSSSALPQTYRAFTIPLIVALRFASRTAPLTDSMPMTRPGDLSATACPEAVVPLKAAAALSSAVLRFISAAANSPMVPTPQYKSRTVSSPFSDAYSKAFSYRRTICSRFT
ncbi:unknown [Firmicutes bacterium CAG:238]|nr:unknown [Firmicutes bacterium CAG:238]